MEAVTYTLKPGGVKSDIYYSEIRAFTDEVIDNSSGYLTPVIENILHF
jgi:hypothetical protein